MAKKPLKVKPLGLPKGFKEMNWGKGGGTRADQIGRLEAQENEMANMFGDKRPKMNVKGLLPKAVKGIKAAGSKKYIRGGGGLRGGAKGVAGAALTAGLLAYDVKKATAKPKTSKSAKLKSAHRRKK